MNRKELADKFTKTQQELAQMVQQLQQLSVAVNERQGQLKLLKELHDSLPEEKKEEDGDSVQS